MLVPGARARRIAPTARTERAEKRTAGQGEKEGEEEDEGEGEDDDEEEKEDEEEEEEEGEANNACSFMMFVSGSGDLKGLMQWLLFIIYDYCWYESQNNYCGVVQ